MPVAACPIPGCTYTTDNADAVIVAALLNAHTVTHTMAPAKLVDQQYHQPARLKNGHISQQDGPNMSLPLV